jgi:signal transduction histidine kinase
MMNVEVQDTTSLTDRIGRFAGSPSVRRGFIACALIAGLIVDWATESCSAAVYAVPIALASAWEGWRSGLLVTATCSAALFALSSGQTASHQIRDVLALVLVSCVVAEVVARERRSRAHFQQIAEQLSGVYERVQANFEGMKRVERLSAIGQLSAGLAHEIRNPLASIAGAAAILARSNDLEPTNTKCLQIITAECDRLNGLLTNFLNFARPRPPHLQAVQLEPVLDNVLALASHGVRGKSLRFERQVQAPLPTVECDPEQLEQVLLNLMINAIEASPDGATITLTAQTEGSKVAIGVIDRGHGVAPAHIDRLFDPFFTTKEHGTGLGLPVAHQIVRQMGGSLVAQPNATEGMTFSILVPAKGNNQ